MRANRAPRPWRRLPACERSDHPSKSPRINTRHTRSANDQQTPPTTAEKSFHGQAESRSHGASLPLPRNDVRSTKPAPPRERAGVRANRPPVRGVGFQPASARTILRDPRAPTRATPGQPTTNRHRQPLPKNEFKDRLKPLPTARHSLSRETTSGQQNPLRRGRGPG